MRIRDDVIVYSFTLIYAWQSDHTSCKLVVSGVTVSLPQVLRWLFLVLFVTL